MRSSIAASVGAATAAGASGFRLHLTATKPTANALVAPTDVRQQPGDAAEAAIQRRTEHFFAAVLGDEGLDDLVVIGHARIDQRGELAAHLM